MSELQKLFNKIKRSKSVKRTQAASRLSTLIHYAILSINEDIVLAMQEAPWPKSEILRLERQRNSLNKLYQDVVNYITI